MWLQPTINRHSFPAPCFSWALWLYAPFSISGIPSHFWLGHRYDNFIIRDRVHPSVKNVSTDQSGMKNNWLQPFPVTFRHFRFYSVKICISLFSCFHYLFDSFILKHFNACIETFQCLQSTGFNTVLSTFNTKHKCLILCAWTNKIQIHFLGLTSIPMHTNLRCLLMNWT
jgi:hypothetical protein